MVCPQQPFDPKFLKNKKSTPNFLKSKIDPKFLKNKKRQLLDPKFFKIKNNQNEEIFKPK